MFFLGFSLVVGQAPTDSITGTVTDPPPLGSISPSVRTAHDLGRAEGSAPMRHMVLVLRRSAQTDAALDELLLEQQDPSASS